MAEHKLVNGIRVELTQAEIDAKNAEEKIWIEGAFERGLVNLRTERDTLLASTDWRDLPSYAGTRQAEWRVYRQALRDLPKGLTTEELVKNVTWPTKPV